MVKVGVVRERGLFRKGPLQGQGIKPSSHASQQYAPWDPKENVGCERKHKQSPDCPRLGFKLPPPRPQGFKTPRMGNCQRCFVDMCLISLQMVFIQTSEGKMCLFCSRPVSCLCSPIELCMGTPFVVQLKRSSTVASSFESGGWQLKQVSKLVERAACWLIAAGYWHLLTRGKALLLCVTSQQNGLQTNQLWNMALTF